MWYKQQMAAAGITPCRRCAYTVKINSVFTISAVRLLFLYVRCTHSIQSVAFSFPASYFTTQKHIFCLTVDISKMTAHLPVGEHRSIVCHPKTN